MPGALEEWTVLKKVVEELVVSYPRQFNPYRDTSKKYDVEEGYKILKRAKLVNAEYQLYEELVSPHHVFTKNGRQALIHAVTKLSKENAPLKIAIYTCGVYIFLIGCRSKRLFLVDTHPIGADLGGNGNGILKVYPADDYDSPYQMCAWIRKRLQISGVQSKCMQSLLILGEMSRYNFLYSRTSFIVTIGMELAFDFPCN